MRLGDSGTAFLPNGCSLPAGPYPVYTRLDLDSTGAVNGEVHFLGEPKYPRPISIGTEFALHIPHPDSIFGDEIILRITFEDESGAVVGYRLGSRAQFRPVVPDAGEREYREAKSLDKRNVFVIHGRDQRLRDGMFTFLRSLGLNPMEWAHAVELTGKGAPYVGEVLDAAFINAQAVVVLFTPDDLARLRPELCHSTELQHEVKLTPQARPNVIFEAGMAMARSPERTILVEMGALRPFSDIGGRHTIRMDNSSQRRNDFATRLKNAGCPVNTSGTDWYTAGDLSQRVISVQEEQLPSSTDRNKNPIELTTHVLSDLISELEDNLDKARAPRVGDVYARPSTSVWKENRNRVKIPHEDRSRLANAYKLIDRWQDIVASGLNTNMGSLPLELIFNDLRNQLPRLASDLRRLERLSHLPKLSSEAQDLLLRAAKETASGSLICTHVNEGLILQVDGHPFCETGNRRSEAKWGQVVDELVELKFIKPLAPDGGVYDVTHAGFEYADQLRSTR